MGGTSSLNGWPGSQGTSDQMLTGMSGMECRCNSGREVLISEDTQITFSMLVRRLPSEHCTAAKIKNFQLRCPARPP